MLIVAHTHLHTYTKNIQIETYKQNTQIHIVHRHSQYTHTEHTDQTHMTHTCFGLLEHIYFLNQPLFFSTKAKLFEQMVHIRLDAHLSTRWN